MRISSLQSMKDHSASLVKISLSAVEKAGDTAFNHLNYSLLDFCFINLVAISVADEYRCFAYVAHNYHHKKARSELRAEKHIALIATKQLPSISRM